MHHEWEWTQSMVVKVYRNCLRKFSAADTHKQHTYMYMYSYIYIHLRGRICAKKAADLKGCATTEVILIKNITMLPISIETHTQKCIWIGFRWWSVAPTALKRLMLTTSILAINSTPIAWTLWCGVATYIIMNVPQVKNHWPDFIVFGASWISTIFNCMWQFWERTREKETKKG